MVMLSLKMIHALNHIENNTLYIWEIVEDIGISANAIIEELQKIKSIR